MIKLQNYQLSFWQFLAAGGVVVPFEFGLLWLGQHRILYNIATINEWVLAGAAMGIASISAIVVNYFPPRIICVVGIVGWTMIWVIPVLYILING